MNTGATDASRNKDNSSLPIKGAVLKTTTRLTLFSRFCIQGASAGVIGIWSLNRSLDSWVDHILDMDGSRMQRELANIIVSKYQNDPGIMQRLYRRFYSENVYDDTTSDKPILRWHYRNYYGDNVTRDQGTHDNDSQGSTHVSPHSSDGKRAQIRSNKVSLNPVVDSLEDPLDIIFGCNAALVKDIDQPVGSTPTRAHSHSQRRAHRRRQRMHKESLSMKNSHVQQI